MGLESARRGEKPTSHLCAPPSFRTIGHFGLMRSVQRSNSMYKKRVHYANKQTLVYCTCVINTEYIITNTTGGPTSMQGPKRARVWGLWYKGCVGGND